MREKPPEREVLPNFRLGQALVFDHDGLSYRAAFSLFNDGSLAELFLDAGKTGSSVNTVAHECAVIISISRQYGVPLSTLYEALPKLQDGTPAGPTGKALKLIMENT